MRNFVIIHYESNDPVREFVKEVQEETEVKAAMKFQIENRRMRIRKLIEGTWDKINYKIMPTHKPKVTINGSDDIITIAMRVRRELSKVYNEQETDAAINELFKDQSLSFRMRAIEQLADVTYNIEA